MQHLVILSDHAAQLALRPRLSFEEIVLLVPCFLYFPSFANNIAVFALYLFNRLVLLVFDIGDTLRADDSGIRNLDLVPQKVKRICVRNGRKNLPRFLREIL